MRQVALAAVVAVALGGCTGDPAAERREVLEAGVERTFEGAVAFNLELDVPGGDDDDVLGAEGAPGGLTALAGAATVAGVVEDDRLAAGLAVAGIDLLQLRVTEPGAQFVRFNLGALTAAAGGDPATGGSELDDRLAAAGVEPDVRRAVVAAAQGEWVRIEAEASGGATAGSSVGDALAALLRTAEPTAHRGDLGERPFGGQLDVEVDTERALATATRVLAGLAPDAVPDAQDIGDGEPLDGRVIFGDGAVRTFVLELGPVDDGDGAPAIELLLELRPLDPDEQLVTEPEATVTLTPEQLSEAADALPGVGG